MTIPNAGSIKAVIHAPLGRDASVASALLDEARIPSVICADTAAFGKALRDDAAFALVTEEALRSADLRDIVAFLKEQPAWSDLPFIILTLRGGGPESSQDVVRLTELLGNVTFLERPFRPATFISLARTALKSRQRQYEARGHIEELHESEERLRTALVAGRLGSIELALGTRKLTTSPACRAIFGRDDADAPFTYRDLVAALPPGDRSRVAALVGESLRTGTDLAVESRILWPDGTVHWAELRARLVLDRTGANSRLVGVASDITERKTAEATLRQLNETLEERVAERTAELKEAHAARLAEIEHRQKTEEQLRQVQKMEMIGQLTGGVAHDFNNLLMVVLGNLELLRKHSPDDAKGIRLIDGALQGARRGAALTQRLLAFARRQDLKAEPRDLVGLVGGMTDLIERSLGPGIELHLDLPAGLPPVMVDVNQLELAVLNLVVNARDAMPDGGSLSITLQPAETAAAQDLPAGRYVRLIVGDTGQGMAGETLRRATEPFFSTKGVGKGTGLGLSMIHGLMIQLNGALRMTSELGNGTRAELWLPVATEAPEAEPAPETAPPPDDSPASYTILVVDDDALIAMSTVDMLEDLGHAVIEANSGEAALEILRNGRAVDLLITDYSMPRMNGAQLADATRRLRPGLPVLLATGYAELPEGRSLDLPRIGKPYRQEQVAAEIRRLLNPGAA
ncbi:hybrid sensor histidine kinase/response regulator [Labrys monachus]|uniref:histidine kinase n=1 Tax=Labrys monachus TaxID=217067 RepID=A0ABU0FAG2_9HYPH|nr:hybrid sensor histidine kinase/response regulator [Labrys monachus]MDQ0391613.1 PAS domain S-box-containing protein [Labrys monachus]